MPPNSDLEPKTRRGRASRERMVEVAAASVADHGIHQMRLDDVLTAAGASKSQLYHYFTDRDGLVEAAVAHRCTEFLDQLIPAFARVATLDDLDATLAGFARNYAQSLAGCPIGTLASDVMAGPEPTRQRVVSAFSAWESLLAEALIRAKGNGELRASADPADLATVLLAGLEGGMLLGQVRQDPAPLKTALAAAMGYVRTFAR